MNPILQKHEDTVDQMVTSPESKEQYERIVTAGKMIMFGEKTHDKISWMQNPTNLGALVRGVADLITIIDEMSKGTMKADPAHGAAVTLVMEALDFANRAQGVEITQHIADSAFKAIDELMRGGGIAEPVQTAEEPAPVEQPPELVPPPTPQPPAPRGLIQG